MKSKLQLYEKIAKTKEHPNGAKKVESNEFLARPALLCISAQDDSKSVFGIAKFGMNVAGVHVRDCNPTGYNLETFPVSFYAIKKEYIEEGQDDMYQTFYDEYLKNIVEEDSKKKEIEGVAKSFRNLNLLVYCNGNERVDGIVQALKNNMSKVGYTDEKINYAVSQIGLVTLATELDTQKIGCSVVDFHDLRDDEVGYRQIHKETVDAVTRNKAMEGYFEVNDRRVEYILADSEEHSIKHYFKDGTATPACLRKVVSNLLESSINASNGDFAPLANEHIMQGCDELLQGAKKGKNKAELIKHADDTISFGGAKKITEQECRLQDMLEEACDSIKGLTKDNSSLRRSNEILEEQKDGILKSVKEMCSQTAYDKIRMDNKLWQFSREEEEVLKNASSDKQTIQDQQETIQSQSKTIESLKGQVVDLLSRIKVVLDFADSVRRSTVGKIFFKNKIKNLPPALEEQPEVGGEKDI